MSRADLLALAARVEAATGADRDIDHAIYAAINPEKPIPFNRRLLPWEHLYTASLDAALSLVPSGHTFDMVSHLDGATVRIFDRTGPVTDCRAAATPALALTAAALRAIAERMPE